MSAAQLSVPSRSAAAFSAALSSCLGDFVHADPSPGKPDLSLSLSVSVSFFLSFPEVRTLPHLGETFSDPSKHPLISHPLLNSFGRINLATLLCSYFGI